MMTINLFVSLLNNTQRHNQLELNMMKKVFWVILFALCMTISVQAQVIDEGSLKKATGWVNDLQLIEQYFTNSGRDWRTMYRAYVQQFFDQDPLGIPKGDACLSKKAASPIRRLKRSNQLQKWL